jgi:catechol 2,3-dioxygenase-like lactoylglutathione lyase family enzyme
MMIDDVPGDLEMKLELVPIPVSDVDRAIAFYVDQIGFNLDHDHTMGETGRFAQLTPPGSGCSILVSVGLGGGVAEMVPGSHHGLHLVVPSAQAARDRLAARGVAVSEVIDMGGILFVYFSDPDGNGWVLQEIPPRFRGG